MVGQGRPAPPVELRLSRLLSCLDRVMRATQRGEVGQAVVLWVTDVINLKVLRHPAASTLGGPVGAPASIPRDHSTPDHSPATGQW